MCCPQDHSTSRTTPKCYWTNRFQAFLTPWIPEPVWHVWRMCTCVSEGVWVHGQTYRTVTLFQLGLLVAKLCYLPVSTPQPPVLELQGLTPVQALLYCVWVIEIQTQVLMLTYQTFYPLSCLPIPKNPFRKTSESTFTRTILGGFLLKFFFFSS